MNQEDLRIIYCTGTIFQLEYLHPYQLMLDKMGGGCVNDIQYEVPVYIPCAYICMTLDAIGNALFVMYCFGLTDKELSCHHYYAGIEENQCALEY